ncbi:proton channel OTOP1-like [Rhinophrynus dorsalis]
METGMTTDTRQEAVDGTLSRLSSSMDFEHQTEEVLFDIPHKDTGIASSQYGINILIVGLFLLLACSIKVKGVSDTDRLIFLITLMLIQLFWMLWFGVIHCVFTNLLLWASAVATDSKHQLAEHLERLRSLGFENITIDENWPDCNCTAVLCNYISKGIYYIYPFNIEYHILASAMFYVLWKNIGSNIKYHKHNTNLKFQGVIVGTVSGLIVLAATIGIIVIYLLRIGLSKSESESALTIYYCYSIIVLTAMCVASVIGLIIYKMEIKLPLCEGSSSIKLDADLLVGSASGSWITSWGSILSIIFAESHPAYTWLNLPYSILVLVEKYVQNLFIITYIYCKDEQTNTDKNANTELSVIPSEVLSADHMNREICTEVEKAEIASLEENDVIYNEKQDTDSGPLPDIRTSNNAVPTKLTIKKLMLKNITVVLFLCNISI